MVVLSLLMIPLAALLAIPFTWIARTIGHRLNALDGPGVAGQQKAASRRVPNTGGMAIFWSFVLPIIAALIILRTSLADRLVTLVPELRAQLPGLLSTTNDAVALLLGLFTLHVLGCIDDRKPLGPWLKLILMTVTAGAIIYFTNTRLLSLLDSHVGGPWLSWVLTLLWIIIVTNAMNFMDNMDGLTAGVTAIAGTCFMAAALIHGQWFIAATLGLLVGSCIGFLAWNFPAPKATVFMGDGGSLVLGFALAFLTVRTTYVDPKLAGGWYAVLMPLLVLAVPLYDFTSVVLIRVRQGRSPFVGDLQHLSHRLVRRGLSRRGAVIIIYGLTGITALGAVIIGSLQPWQAAVVAAQSALVLIMIAIYEHNTEATQSASTGGLS